MLVVGAGPAGMECATVLGRRGFEAVHLVEAEPEIGGRLRWMRQLPTLGDWGRITDYRAIQLDQAAERRGDHRAPARPRPTSSTTAPQIVVVATGSHWRGDGVAAATTPSRSTGADAALAHVLTPEQVMVEGKRPPGRRVVVYDTDGYFVGARGRRAAGAARASRCTS